MTPQNKANSIIEQLNESIHDCLNCHVVEGFCGKASKNKLVIDTALILTAEVLKVIPMYRGELNPDWQFWENVRMEIIKRSKNL